MTNKKLSVGYLKKLDEEILNDRNMEGVNYWRYAPVPSTNHCYGQCGKSYSQCIKGQKLSIKKNREQLKSLETRFQGMVMTIKNNSHYIPLHSQFNHLEFGEENLNDII